MRTQPKGKYVRTLCVSWHVNGMSRDGGSCLNTFQLQQKCHFPCPQLCTARKVGPLCGLVQEGGVECKRCKNHTLHHYLCLRNRDQVSRPHTSSGTDASNTAVRWTAEDDIAFYDETLYILILPLQEMDVGNLERKRTLWRSRRTWEDGIKWRTENSGGRLWAALVRLKRRTAGDLLWNFVFHKSRKHLDYLIIC
jgi:hypothetical protein